MYALSSTTLVNLAFDSGYIQVITVAL